MTTQQDWYAILGLHLTASETDIKKAYRKQALLCHPDKNQDDPTAQERFHLLTTAYDVLMDSDARRAYDAVIIAKIEKEKRYRTMDEKRKQMRDELSRREEESMAQQQRDQDAQALYQRHLQRLREDSAKRQKEREQQLREAMEEASGRTKSDHSVSSASSVSELDRTVRIQWKKPLVFTEESLSEYLCKFLHKNDLELVAIVKKRAAMVQCKSVVAAHRLVSKAMTDSITISWASGSAPEVITNSEKAKPDVKSSTVDYETATLLRMQMARDQIDRDAKRRKILQQLSESS